MKPNVAVCCPFLKRGLVEEIHACLRADTSRFYFWSLEGATPPSLQGLVRGQGWLPKLQIYNLLYPFYRDADYVLFIDDDLQLMPGFLAHFLSAVQEFQGDYAQPALAAGSHYNFDFTLQQPKLRARRTDFVEWTVYLFSRRFLQRTYPFPVENRYGWGIDIHWSDLANREGFRMLIVDAYPVLHTRAVGTSYSLFQAYGEFKRFLSSRNLSDPRFQTLESFPLRP